MKALDVITKSICIPYRDDKPKRRKWGKFLAKVGTGCGTVIWADKEELNEGDMFLFVDTFDLDLEDKSRYIAYPSPRIIKTGIVTSTNGERVFISLV